MNLLRKNLQVFFLLISLFFVSKTVNAQFEIKNKSHRNYALQLVQGNKEKLNKIEVETPFCISNSSAQKTKADEVILGEKTILELDISFNKEINKQKNDLLKISLPLQNGKELKLNLKQINIADNNNNESTFYWGTVEGDPMSFASFSVFKNKILSIITTQNGTYTLGGIKNSDLHILYQEADLPGLTEFVCSTVGSPETFIEEESSTFHRSANNRIVNPDNCIRQCFIVASDLAAQFSYDVPTINNYITGFFSQIKLIFANEHINMRLEDISIEGANNECLSGPCTRTGDNYMKLRTLGGGFGGGSVCAGGGESGIETTYQDYPVISGGIGTVAHEIGHGLGSPHTDICYWNGNDTQIDDCGTSGNFEAGGACFNPYDLTFPTGGSSIMSYCGGYVDMGEQPGDLMRHNVYTSSCLTTCDELPCIDADDNNVCDKDECNFNPIVCEAHMSGVYRYGTPGDAGGACDVVLFPGESIEFDPKVHIAGASFWTGPNGFSSTDQKITVSDPGVYTYTITDDFCTYSKDMSITIDNCGENPITYNTTAPNINFYIEFHAGDIIDIEMQPSTGTWSWNGPNGYTSSSNNVSLTQVGEYVVTYTENGCSYTETVRLVECAPNFLGTLVRSSSNSTWQNSNVIELNHGEYAELRGTYPTGISGNWSWVGPNGFFDEQKENNIIRPIEPGIYTATLFATKGVQACNYSIDFEVKMIDGSPTNNFPVPISDGIYFMEFSEIQNKRIGKVCDLEFTRVNSLEEENPYRWRINKNTNDEYFTIQNVATNNYFQVVDNIRSCDYASSFDATSNVLISDLQQWRILLIDGDFYLSSKQCPARVISASNAAPDKVVHRIAVFGNAYQKISLIPTDDMGPGYLEGASCDDGDICTDNDIYANCICAGTMSSDVDNDDVCDLLDVCSGYDDFGDGLECNSLSCSNYSMLTENCECLPATNIALNSSVSGSSLHDVNRPHTNLINENFNDVTHTSNSSPYEWLELDLGTNELIEYVRILNRTDCCTKRMNNTYLMIADTPFPQNTDLTAALANADFTHQFGDVSNESEVAVYFGQSGRYIRLQKSGNNDEGNYINLREIVVLGKPMCDDGNSLTTNDMFDANCNCVGTPTLLGPTIKFVSKLMLEGFLQPNGEMTQEAKNLNLIPLQQPFNNAPWNYAGMETLTSIPDDMVDWVLINAYDTNENIIGTQAALLLKNGEIRNVDNSQVIKFALSATNVKYISVHHKSHLAVVTNADGFINGSDFVIANIVENPEQAGTYIPNLDFTLDAVALGIEQIKFMQGTRCAISGDFDGNGIINNLDYNVWEQNNSAVYYYLNQDADGNGIINNLDYNLWDINKSKVGNPLIQQ